MPIPSVAVNIINNQTVGLSLILECHVITVRGITSRVDIMWSSDGLELNIIRGVNISLVRDHSISFIDTYTIPKLSTADENKEYQCEVSINAQSPVIATGGVTLNVTGKHIRIIAHVTQHYINIAWFSFKFQISTSIIHHLVPYKELM